MTNAVTVMMMMMMMKIMMVVMGVMITMTIIEDTSTAHIPFMMLDLGLHRWLGPWTPNVVQNFLFLKRH